MWKLAGKTMGTTYSVVAVPATSSSESDRAALHRAIDAVLEQVNDDMSTWRKDSDLSKFNAHQATTPYAARPSTAKVVQLSLDLADKTDGAFDVTLGPLIRLWGFDRDGRRQAPPDDDVVQNARARVGWKKVRVEGTTLRKTRPDVDVNLSGVAKGYGVDEVVRLLQQRGVKAALVEIGGEVRSFGRKEGGKSFTVGISLPDATAKVSEMSHALPLDDKAMATSGDYRNFFESNNKRYSHIIDPTTGNPVDHDLVSASVVAPDCATADGLATAMLVMGPTKGKAVLESLDGVDGLFIRKTKDGFVVDKTAGFPKTHDFLPAPSRTSAQ